MTNSSRSTSHSTTSGKCHDTELLLGLEAYKKWLKFEIGKSGIGGEIIRLALWVSVESE